MTDQVRKSIPVLIAEYDEDRKMYGKTFHHYRTKDDYQLLFPVWQEETNEKMFVYCMSAMPKLKFVRPVAEFKKSFIEGPYAEVSRLAKEG